MRSAPQHRRICWTTSELECHEMSRPASAADGAAPPAGRPAERARCGEAPGRPGPVRARRGRALLHRRHSPRRCCARTRGVRRLASTLHLLRVRCRATTAAPTPMSNRAEVHPGDPQLVGALISCGPAALESDGEKLSTSIRVHTRSRRAVAPACAVGNSRESGAEARGRARNRGATSSCRRRKSRACPRRASLSTQRRACGSMEGPRQDRRDQRRAGGADPGTRRSCDAAPKLRTIRAQEDFHRKILESAPLRCITPIEALDRRGRRGDAMPRWPSLVHRP
jgi:hypothetical protein